MPNLFSTKITFFLSLPFSKKNLKSFNECYSLILKIMKLKTIFSKYCLILLFQSYIVFVEKKTKNNDARDGKIRGVISSTDFLRRGSKSFYVKSTGRIKFLFF